MIAVFLNQRFNVGFELVQILGFVNQSQALTVPLISF
jgi:hypothetical protein